MDDNDKPASDTPRAVAVQPTGVPRALEQTSDAVDFRGKVDCLGYARAAGNGERHNELSLLWQIRYR